MFDFISLLVWPTIAAPPQFIAPSLLNASSINCTNASTLNASNIFRCYTPAFPPPGPFYPITYSRCTNAADELIADVRVDVPLTFNRRENADVRLPWQARSENAMLTLDVLNQDDEDIMCIEEVHRIALALCKICVREYYRCGGTRPVGPRGVVQISVYATGPDTVEPGLPQTSHVVAQRIERRGLDLLNISSLASTGTSVLNVSDTEKGECFSESGPSAREHLYPVKSLDCMNAAAEMLKNKRDHIKMKFGRRVTRGGLDFKLPWTARNKSCIVTVDTLKDEDFDKIVLWEVYQTALNRIEECTTGENIFGGRKVVGSKNVVYVFVFGFGSPLQMSAPALSAPTHVVARAPIKNSELSLLNTSSSQTTAPQNSTSPPITKTSSLHGIPECFPPPSPREHSVPITNFIDCKLATMEIIGSRSRTQIYVFSRQPSTAPDHYQLPATFRTRTCVVHLDMESADDEDSVQLVFVESTAWVLAHKCSGLEDPEERWGGTMTVSVGAKDRIRVWVYGALPQGLEGPSAVSTVASLLGSE